MRPAGTRRAELRDRRGAGYGHRRAGWRGQNHAHAAAGGLLAPTGGRATVCGFDTIEGALGLHHAIGYMPQRFGLYEDLTVLENLTLYADLRGVVGKARGESFERLLAFTDLARFTGRLAGKLSGGMKQKLGLACAMLRSPRLLLLDEPSVGVDRSRGANCGAWSMR